MAVGPGVGTSVGMGVGIAVADGTGVGVWPVKAMFADTNRSPRITTVALAPSRLVVPCQLIADDVMSGVASIVTELPGT